MIVGLAHQSVSNIHLKSVTRGIIMGGHWGKYCGNILTSDTGDNTLGGINRLDLKRKG